MHLKEESPWTNYTFFFLLLRFSNGRTDPVEVLLGSPRVRKTHPLIFLFPRLPPWKGNGEMRKTYRLDGLAKRLELGAALLDVAKISLLPEKIPRRLQGIHPEREETRRKSGFRSAKVRRAIRETSDRK